KFQEYGGRLRELRLGLGLREYHVLTAQLTTETVKLDDLRGEMSASHVQVAVWEAEARQLDGSLGGTEGDVARATEGLSEVRRQIATFQERWAQEGAKAEDAAGELATSQRRSVELAELVRGLEATGERARGDVTAAEGEAEVRRGRAA